MIDGASKTMTWSILHKGGIYPNTFTPWFLFSNTRTSFIFKRIYIHFWRDILDVVRDIYYLFQPIKDRWDIDTRFS